MAVSRHQILKNSARILREVLIVERKTLTEVRKYLNAISAKARSQLRKKKVDTTFEFPNVVKQLYSNMLLIQYLQGKRRVYLAAKEQVNNFHNTNVLQLSFQGDTLKKLQRLLTLDEDELEFLRDKFDTQALAIFSDLDASLNNQLVSYINELIGEGLTTRDSVALLEDKLDRMGFTPRNSYTVENIFRTQSQIAYNAGKYQTEQSEAVQEILWGYTYVTVGDSRVRPEHAAQEGVTLPKEDPFWSVWYPPNGWSCRCSVIPIFEKKRIKRPNTGIQPDEGFEFNPGEVTAAVFV